MSNQIAAEEESARATQAQRDADEVYANDVNTLAAVFRTKYGRLLYETQPSDVFSAVLLNVSRCLTRQSSDNEFMRAVLYDHGPGAVLLALKRAYDQPEHVTSDVVEYP